MNITTLGIDLAKNVFQLHGVDAQGKIILKKKINRPVVVDFIAQMPKCLIGIMLLPIVKTIFNTKYVYKSFLY